MPVGITLSKLLLDYHNRLAILNRKGDNQLVRHAYAEQVSQQLTWFRSINELTAKFDQEALRRQSNKDAILTPNSKLVRTRLEDWFLNKWEEARGANRKLGFYNSVKRSFGPEPYISFPNHKKVKCMVWLRTSSHKLKIESGRHGSKILSLHHRACDTCCSNDSSTLELLCQLPLTELILEDEIHVLRDCPAYQDLRESSSESLRTALTTHNPMEIFDRILLNDSMKFVRNIFLRRFPKSNI